MRLLSRTDDGRFHLRSFVAVESPRYAILSHTWGADGDEVTYRDLTNDVGRSKAGYRKIRFCAEQAATDGLEYFWIDTCCIDPTNQTELSEAINTMFRWYQQSERCYVYLSDVSVTKSDKEANLIRYSAFRNSRWFTRSWTLQELLAPRSVVFFSQEGLRLGDKVSLERQIHEITGLPIQAFRDGRLSDFSVKERLSWAENRRSRREEDAAYSLLGIFGVHIPLIYGEGKDNAFRRLKEEIAKAEMRMSNKSDLNLWLDGQGISSANINAARLGWNDEPNPDDIDRESIASTETWGSGVTIDPVVNRTLIEDFAAMILEDRILKSALSMGSNIYGTTSDRLQRNLTRFLKSLARNLEKEAESKDQTAVVGFVGSRARLVSELICSGTQDNSSTQTANMNERLLLEQFLRSLPVFASNETVMKVESPGNKIEDQHEDEGDEGDHEQSFEDYDELSELSIVRKFIITSTAWELFQNGLLDWVCPPWAIRLGRVISEWLEDDHEAHLLRKVLMVADDIANMDPRTLIFEEGKESSCINHIKGFIEKLSHQQWDWWPLSPHYWPLSDNERRLAWTCACGEQQMALLPQDLSMSIQRIAREFLIEELKAFEQGIDLNIIPYDTNSDPKSSSTSSQLPAPSISGLTGPSIGLSVPTRTLEPHTVHGGFTGSSTSAPTTSRKREASPFFHLFFVVNCDKNPKFEQKPTATITFSSNVDCLVDDESLYKWIRRQYIKHRGRFHFYLGIRQFAGCDFYQFNHYAPKSVSPHSEIMQNFPQQVIEDYVYRAVKQFPPIGRHEFKQQVFATGPPWCPSLLLAGRSVLKAIWQGSWSLTVSPKGFEFHSRSQKLPTTRLNFGGACRRNTKSALERLPKRKFRVDEENDELDIFIGICSRETISARHFIGWFLIFCSPTLIFALVYLFSLGHSGDLQDAFVLMSVTMPLLTILFSPFLIPQLS